MQIKATQNIPELSELFTLSVFIYFSWRCAQSVLTLNSFFLILFCSSSPFGRPRGTRKLIFKPLVSLNCGAVMSINDNQGIAAGP